MAAPMIPFLNDAELESILEAAAGAGAAGASYILLRLPLELKELFAEWLDAHAPGKARHVLNMVRESRGGRLYDSDFSTRMPRHRRLRRHAGQALPTGLPAPRPEPGQGRAPAPGHDPFPPPRRRAVEVALKSVAQVPRPW